MLRLYIHYLYWLLIFGTGIIQLLGLNSGIYKLGIPFLTVILLVYSFISKGNELKFPFISWYLAFIGVSIISSVVNGIDYFSLLYFLIYTSLSYFYFIILYNEINFLIIKKIVSFIKILVLIQIPAIFIKYILIGQTEHGGIGTLSINAGSVSTIFPLFIITILFCLYLFKNKNKYLIYILLFSLMGIIGNKRAILIFIPIILMLTTVLFVKLEKSRWITNLWSKISLACIVGIAVFYITARTNKTLNPERSNWGSFDLKYIITYVDNYTSSKSNDKYQMRRKDGLVYFINHTLEAQPEQMLLGDGAGKLIESKYNTRIGSVKNEYGVRYGGRMGLIWLLLQIGVLGTIIYLLFYMRLFSLVLNKYRSNPIYLAFLALTIVFFLDIIIYSNVFLRYEYLKGLYFVILALILLDQKYRTNYFSKMVMF